jgi:non-specific protein-tyrosine kinase
VEDTSNQDEIDLRHYAAILWRRAWLIALSAVLASGAAFVASWLQTPVYQASTTLLVNQAPGAQTSEYTAILTSERLASTYAQMLSQRPVMEEALKRLQLSNPVEDMQKAVTIELVRDTQLIRLKVEDPDPYLAATLADILVGVFNEQNDARQAQRYAASKENLKSQLDQLQADIQTREARIAELGSRADASGQAEADRLRTDVAQLRASYATLLKTYEDLRLAEAQSVSNVVQVEPATVPTEPVRPRTLLNTLLAAVVGVMLAIGVVFLIEYLDNSIKTPEEARARLDLPVLGMIAKIPENSEGSPYVAENPRAPVAEAFRSLRSNISFSAIDRPIRSLLITSPGPEDGKSTVATNLAVVMAQGGRRVVLMEADMRRPRLHRMMGLPNRLGLSDLFVRPLRELGDAVQPSRFETLAVLTSGGLPPNPAELLGTERMTQILQAAAQAADIVIIDSPPMGVVTDASVLAPRVDAVLLVVEPGQTPLAAARQAVDQLRRAGANVIGLVFNNVVLKRGGYYNGYYSGHYSYEYAYGEDGRTRSGGKARHPRGGGKEKPASRQ